MPVPQIPLWEAFAIGIPLGIAGFGVQEVIIRRRRLARSPVEAASSTAPTVDREPRAAQAEVDVTPTPTDPIPTPVEAPKPLPAVSLAAPEKRQGARALAALRKLETNLDAAIEAVVDFVDGPPRRARAQACADEATRLVSKAKRGPAFGNFVTALEAGTGPGALQQLAEDLGVELAVQLQATRREIKSLS